MHTLVNLRGAIPTFIHISEGKLHEVNVLDFLPGSTRCIKKFFGTSENAVKTQTWCAVSAFVLIAIVK